jgi:flagellar hook-length control protein FliK
MSTQTVMPPDMLAASERVQQLQRLITRAGREPSEASFAASLAAASSGSPAETSPQTPTASAASATAGSGSEAGAQTSAYDATIAEVAARYGLDPALLHGLIEQESGFDPSARSGAGALGLTQLMPATAAALGVSEPLNPTQSIEGGARYLKQMLERFGGNTADALAAYNAGAGAVEQYGGVPPYGETQAYVAKVMADASAYRQSLSMASSPALLPVASASAAPAPSAPAAPSAPSMSTGSAVSPGPTVSPGPAVITESHTSAGAPSGTAQPGAVQNGAASSTVGGTTPTGTTPTGTAPTGTTPAGTTPAGTTPIGTVPIGAATGGTASLNPTAASSAAVGTYGANLQQTIEAVHATIELAARGGYTQARIALQPEELGEIRVHLSQSAQGLIVRLTASTPSAAAALAAGHGELRQSLSSLGLSALHLEGLVSEHAGAGVGSHAGERGAAHDAALAAGARHGQRSGAGSSEGEGEEPADENQLSQPAATTRIVLHGALVDVFA